MTRIFPITGFREAEDHPTGMHDLRRDVLDPLDGLPGIDVEPVRPWKSEWDRLAFRARLDGITKAIIIAYSWGGGWAAQKLATHLAEARIRVDLMLLCDPVYRPQWLPAWGPANIFGFRALIPQSATIQIPDSVERVLGVRQENDIPRGHPIRWAGVKFHLPVIDSTHRAIDSAPQWHDLVRRELAHHFKL